MLKTIGMARPCHGCDLQPVCARHPLGSPSAGAGDVQARLFSHHDISATLTGAAIYRAVSAPTAPTIAGRVADRRGAIGLRAARSCHQRHPPISGDPRRSAGLARGHAPLYNEREAFNELGLAMRNLGDAARTVPRGGSRNEAIDARRLADLTRDGFSYRAIAPLPVGAVVQVSMMRGRAVAAHVTRRDGLTHRCAFTVPLTEHEIATLARSPAASDLPPLDRWPRLVRIGIFILGGIATWAGAFALWRSLR